MDAVIEGNEVVQMRPSPGTPRRLEFVENFFAGTSIRLTWNTKSKAERRTCPTS
jgi:hypothetical protein